MQPECPNTIRNGGLADSRKVADFRHDAVDRQVASLASLLQFLWRRIGNHYGHLRELAVFGFHRD